MLGRSAGFEEDLAPGTETVEVTVMWTRACHFCSEAEQALEVLADLFPLRVRVVELESPEGVRLTRRHRPAMNPLVLLDGQFFSAGRLPVKKLTARLKQGSKRPPAMVADHG